MKCVHYVGFTDDRFNNAYKVFGGPVIIHRKWDKRARRHIDFNEDIVVFANGPHDQETVVFYGSDIDEKWLSGANEGEEQ